jgi:hypothetical protein
LIGTALVILFCALALVGAWSRAASARSFRDGSAFALWCGAAVVVALFAVSTVVFRDAYASLYDHLTGSLSSK